MSSETTSAFTVLDLRCERTVDPVGLDVEKPRLSWRIATTVRNFKQGSYRVVVGSRPGEADLWDSGTVQSDRSQEVRYEGEPVASGAVAFWTVSVQDESGVSVISPEGKWQTGLGQDWSAQWIEADVVGGPRSSTYAPYLRKVFEIEAEVRSARLYITALGLYQARINGQKVGDLELTPGWTDYKRRVRYQVYEVASLLALGENCLGAILGDGWYCGHIGWLNRQYYGDRPKLLAYLKVEFVDGSSLDVGTDSSWSYSTGAIQSADLLMGETQDLRLEPCGWGNADYDATNWAPVHVVSLDVHLESQNSPGIKVIDRLKPVSVKEVPSWPTNRYLFDLGQNMVGRVRLEVSGEKGQTITLRYGERLDNKGALYTENYRSARSTDYVTLTGEGTEVFEPSFTFHGFQYVEVAGLKTPPTEDTLSGVVLHSGWTPTGSFHCSDVRLNQLFSNIRWGWKGNSVDVPTDCPQRDERLGWTGDAQVFVRTACFLGDVQGFFEKFQQDLADSQHPDGVIPSVAPDVNVTIDGGPAWSDAFVICPWTIYRHFGDLEILRKHYDAMKRWLASLELSSRDFIRSYEEYVGFKGFGDWLSTNAETSIDLIGTAFYALSANLMSNIAKVLDFDEDGAQFDHLFAKVKAAFQNRYVTNAGLIAGESQTAYVLALHFDLLPTEARTESVKRLVADIKKRGWKLSTGFVGTPYLLHVLSENRELDVAYRLLLQTEWPSWLYPVTKGATTIWERWDGWTEDKGFQDVGMNSFNHYAYGAVGDWLVSTVAGIDLDPDIPAYQRAVLAPRPGGGLTSAGASLATRYGVISSEWEIREGKFVWHVTVPPNASATLTFPPESSNHHFDGSTSESSLVTGSGRYLLTAEWSIRETDG